MFGRFHLIFVSPEGEHVAKKIKLFPKSPFLLQWLNIYLPEWLTDRFQLFYYWTDRNMRSIIKGAKKERKPNSLPNESFFHWTESNPLSLLLLLLLLLQAFNQLAKLQKDNRDIGWGKPYNKEKIGEKQESLNKNGIHSVGRQPAVVQLFFILIVDVHSSIWSLLGLLYFLFCCFTFVAWTHILPAVKVRAVSNIRMSSFIC